MLHSFVVHHGVRVATTDAPYFGARQTLAIQWFFHHSTDIKRVGMGG